MVTKKRLVEFYVQNRNYLHKGLGEIHAIKTIFYINGVATLMVSSVYSPESKFVYYILWPALTIGLAFGCWFAGRWWDKIKGYLIEAEWLNKRNPAMIEIRENTKKVVK